MDGKVHTTGTFLAYANTDGTAEKKILKMDTHSTSVEKKTHKVGVSFLVQENIKDNVLG